MPNKLIALVKAGTGPTLYTSDMEEISLQIKGLQPGEVVTASTSAVSLEYREAGIFEMPRCDWIIVSAIGECKTLICSILERGNALRSA
jgi:hypothetical protein